MGIYASRATRAFKGGTFCVRDKACDLPTDPAAGKTASWPFCPRALPLYHMSHFSPPSSTKQRTCTAPAWSNTACMSTCCEDQQAAQTTRAHLKVARHSSKKGINGLQRCSCELTTGCPSASSSQAPSLPNGSIRPSCCAKVDKGASCVATCTVAGCSTTCTSTHVSEERAVLMRTDEAARHICKPQALIALVWLCLGALHRL